MQLFNYLFKDCPKQIGELYITMTDVHPEKTWPGTSWERITDCFLRAADDSHPAGTTGGAWEIVQTVKQMPKHNHAYSSYQQGYPKDFTDADHYITPVAMKPYSEAIYSGTEGSYSGAGEPMPIVNKYTAVYMWRRTA